MKQMKNIKTPTYAVRLGKGLFAGDQPTYQCRYCGKTAYTKSQPGGSEMGPCSPGHSQHSWKKC